MNKELGPQQGTTVTTLTLIQSMPVLGKNVAPAWVCTWCSARQEACSLLKCDIVGASVLHTRLPLAPLARPGTSQLLGKYHMGDSVAETP